MPRISAIICTHNEEKRIEECLKDLRPVVDEIIVVDGASTDRTVELAKKYADKIIHDVDRGYCEPARPIGWQHATGHWILVLDADERLTDTLKRKLRELMKRADKEYLDGYRLLQDFYWNGKLQWTKGGGHHGIGNYRFFRKQCVRFLNEIHTEPQPVSKNVQTLPFSGYIHSKTSEEQTIDNKRYRRVIEATIKDPAKRKKKRRCSEPGLK